RQARARTSMSSSLTCKFPASGGWIENSFTSSPQRAGRDNPMFARRLHVTATSYEPAAREQRLLRNARREGLVIIGLWAVVLLWSTISSYVMGYQPRVRELQKAAGGV